MSVESRLARFRTSFDKMNAAQKAALMSRLQIFIATQSADPAIRVCPMANQVENHFRTPPAMINAGWWNLLSMWKTSPLVDRVLNEV